MHSFNTVLLLIPMDNNFIEIYFKALKKIGGLQRSNCDLQKGAFVNEWDYWWNKWW